MSLESQLAALIDAIGADIKNKVNTTDSRLSNSREWNAATVPRAEAEAGTAATRRAWTAARVRQAIRAAILGTVSQESGVPTGAIIERGSNANGSYVRFADGTQICIRISNRVADGSTVDSGYRPWVFPADFASPPSTSLSVNSSLGSGRRMVNLFMTGTTTNGDYRYDMSSAASETLVEKAMAIGHWF